VPIRAISSLISSVRFAMRSESISSPTTWPGLRDQQIRSRSVRWNRAAGERGLCRIDGTRLLPAARRAAPDLSHAPDAVSAHRCRKISPARALGRPCLRVVPCRAADVDRRSGKLSRARNTPQRG